MGSFCLVLNMEILLTSLEVQRRERTLSVTEESSKSNPEASFQGLACDPQVTATNQLKSPPSHAE